MTATIVEKVTIPENRRLRLDLALPASLPAGAAEVRVTIVPGAASRPDDPRFADFAGCLRGSRLFGQDGLEFQREARDGW